MQFNFRLLSVASLALLATVTSCKKDNSKTTDADTQLTTEMQTQSDDYNAVSNNVDEADNDVNIAVEGSAFLSGKTAGTLGITGYCGTTVVADSVANPRTITVTYDGNNCAGTYYRTGSIKISAPKDMRWRNAGATITVTFQNVKLKRLADNKTITINGTQTITNVSGGLLVNLSSLPSIVHTITSSNMSITFDDNTQRTWNVSRKRTFTFNNGVVLKITGTGTSGTATNLAEWGTNRLGHAFTTAITEPLTFRQDCGGRLTSGQIRHEGVGTSTVTFGLNAAGEATTCPTGSYYLKLVWTGANNNTHTVITPY